MKNSLLRLVVDRSIVLIVQFFDVIWNLTRRIESGDSAIESWKIDGVEIVVITPQMTLKGSHNESVE